MTESLTRDVQRALYRVAPRVGSLFPLLVHRQRILFAARAVRVQTASSRQVDVTVSVTHSAVAASQRAVPAAGSTLPQSVPIPMTFSAMTAKLV